MYKVAQRWLSGVSVFYGDDITRRESDGELVIFLGQATKGPLTPVTLRTADNAIGIFGPNNPLVKAIYEFHDGYLDSDQAVPLKLVALRVGGINALVTMSFGTTIATTDAYNGIEDDFFVYINDASALTACVKIWDKNRLLVFDSLNNVDAGYFTVEDLPTGTSGKIYGENLDTDVNAAGVTLANIVKEDTFSPTLADVAVTEIAAVDTTIVADCTDLGFDIDKLLYPSSGTLAITSTLGAYTSIDYVDYTSISTDVAGQVTFALASAFGKDITGQDLIKVEVLGAAIVPGDSEIGISRRALYEKMRNALLEVEHFTPDYIVPGGIYFGEVGSYSKENNASSEVTVSATDTASAIVLNDNVGPTAGRLKISSGMLFNGADALDEIDFVNVSVSGSDYSYELLKPTFEISTEATQDSTSITIAETLDGATLASLPATGFIKINATVYYYVKGAIDTLNGTVDLTIGKFDSTGNGTITTGGILEATLPVGTVIEKVLGKVAVGRSIAFCTFNTDAKYDIGIGYARETDEGDHYSFQWSDVPAAGYNIADFAYLIARFCDSAAVEYNMPLTAMNVSVPATFTRADIVSWIGTNPTYKYNSGASDAVEAIALNGTGLLGNAIMVGTKDYNRSYLSDPQNNEFADPAYGLLLTDEGFIDGHETKDTYGNVIDLGKFMSIGAGVLTFYNRASGKVYNDSCGIYSLGLLSGTPKNEGISFKRIGRNSNVTVQVVVNRKLYNDLAGAGYIVTTREKGLGWVINNDNSASRSGSGYFLISTTRLIKHVIEEKRSLLAGFIGKPLNRFYYEAARTKIADAFRKNVDSGYLNGYTFDLQVSDASRAIGKLYLKCAVNTPLEITQIDIDTVIDRNLQGNG